MKSVGRIAKRYAKALFAQSKGDLVRAKEHLEVLETLSQLFNTKDAGKILRSPVMSTGLKTELLEYGLKTAKADQTVQHSVKGVLAAGRVSVIPEITTAFRELIYAVEGIVEAEITTAVALPKVEFDAIATELGKIIDKRVIATPKVDPTVLGGFAVAVGNYRVDMSLKSKLDGLAHAAVQDSFR
jgi:F-type H+-transporting ATPase subunit delta